MAKSKSAKAAKTAPSVCNLILPTQVDHIKGIAQKLIDEQKISVADVNGGRFTADEVETLWGKEIVDGDDNLTGYTPGSMNDAFYRDAARVPTVPAAHQPVLLKAAKSLDMTFAFVGQASRASKQPASWPSHLPAWKAGYSIEDRGGRAMSPSDIRRHITDERFLVKIGGSEYVVGDEKSNAVHNIHGSKGANTYGYNCRAIKKLAFRGRDKDLANVVFQINSGIATVPHVGDRTTGAEIVYLPNMVATAGHFVRNAKTLTYIQIARAVESGDSKGIRFKALSEPIVGNSVTQTQLVAAVKKLMQAKSTVDDKGRTAWDLFLKTKKGNKEDAAAEAIWYNATVQTRNNALVTFCFGLRNSVINQPLAMVYGDDKTDKRITCIVGLRCGDATTFASREAIAVDEAEAPTPKAAKPAAKRPKRQSTKKVTTPTLVVEPTDAPDEPAATEISDTAEDAEDALATVNAEAEAELDAETSE